MDLAGVIPLVVESAGNSVVGERYTSFTIISVMKLHMSCKYSDRLYKLCFFVNIDAFQLSLNK